MKRIPIYTANVRAIAQSALGITLPASMIRDNNIEIGKAIIRLLPDGSYNMVLLSEEDYSIAMSKVGKTNA